MCHVHSVPVRTSNATSGHVPSTKVLEGTVGLHLAAAEPFYNSVDGNP
jgi:hypothetical protein